MFCVLVQNIKIISTVRSSQTNVQFILLSLYCTMGSVLMVLSIFSRMPHIVRIPTSVPDMLLECYIELEYMTGLSI